MRKSTKFKYAPPGRMISKKTADRRFGRSKLTSTLMTVILASLLGLSACGGEPPTPTPTPIIVEVIQTDAVATFASGLTQTALANPTPTLTFTPEPTLTPFPSLTPAATGTSIPTATCYALAFVKDVTIPDNTPMKPGETFTKTWRIRNAGTCVWETGFKFAFTGGDAMSGATQVLSKAVNPNEEIEISVPMVAPNKSGSIRGNWRMAKADGTFFGEEVFVVITVSGATGTTPAATATATDTETPTEEP